MKNRSDKSKMITIMMLNFVNFLGFTIFIPVLPFIVKDYGAPTWVYGLLLAAYPAAQFFGAAILGEMSDRIGRKPVLLFSQFGTLMSWVVVALSYLIGQISDINMIWPLGILMLARVVDGITGGNVAVANAYLTDITPKKELTKRFGQVGAMTGLALLAGPVIGSVSSATRFGYLGMAVSAFIISLITLIAMWRYLEESLPNPTQAKRTESRLSQINIVHRLRSLHTRPGGKFMLGLSGGFGVILAGYSSIIVLFIIDRFELSQAQLGAFLLFVGTFLIFNQSVMVPRFVKKFGDLKTFMIGILLLGVGFIIIILTDNLILYTALYYVLNLGLSLVLPTSKSLLSAAVSEKNQGEVMGIDESLRSASNAVIPIGMGALYGAVSFKSFYLLAAISFSLFLIFIARNRLQKTK